MKKNKILVFNPLNEDFTVSYHGKGKFTLKAKKVGEFEPIVANHVKRHLANRIFDLRGDYRKSREPQIKKFYKEMEV